MSDFDDTWIRDEVRDKAYPVPMDSVYIEAETLTEAITLAAARTLGWKEE